METKKTLKIEIENLTESQAIALEDMLATWQWLGSSGASRWTAFYADGDGNFQPKITIDGRKPEKTSVINIGFPSTFKDVKFNKNLDFWRTIKIKNNKNGEWRDEYEVYMIDFDVVACHLRKAEEN